MGEVFPETGFNRPFEIQLNKNLPFWRFCVLESNQDPTHSILVFVFHHALMDTKSALSFHEELEGYIAEYAGLEPSDTIYSPSHALFPPLEELHTLPFSQEFLQSQEKHHEPSSDSWTGTPQVTPVKTRFSSLWLHYGSASNVDYDGPCFCSSVKVSYNTGRLCCVTATIPSGARHCYHFGLLRRVVIHDIPQDAVFRLGRSPPH